VPLLGAGDQFGPGQQARAALAQIDAPARPVEHGDAGVGQPGLDGRVGQDGRIDGQRSRGAGR
jgi:hypothetical protein